ncbi:hypothetical protein D3C86_1886990 [compost metagenome]
MAITASEPALKIFPVETSTTLRTFPTININAAALSITISIKLVIDIETLLPPLFIHSGRREAFAPNITMTKTANKKTKTDNFAL